MLWRLNLARIASGVAVGLVFIALAFGAWYYYIMFVPSPVQAKNEASLQQAEAAIRAKYCGTPKEDESEFIREICAKDD